MAHQPKTELAREMILRALDAGIPARWVTGDAVYGESYRLRASLEERNQPHVPAVSGKTYFWQGGVQHAVRTSLAALATDPPTAWARLSAGRAAKDP